jgi:hypothetical protein
MDKLGYHCFPTPTESEFKLITARCNRHLADGGAITFLPHANQLWMLAGFSLFRTLRKSKKCIELFPHAIIRGIGVHSKHKTTNAGYADQLNAAARITGWTKPNDLHEALKKCAYGTTHDRLDSFLSAWIAALPRRALRPYGVSENDVIWLPNIDFCSSSEYQRNILQK